MSNIYDNTGSNYDLGITHDPQYQQHIRTAIKQLLNTHVDFAWLSDYDLDMLEAIRDFAFVETCKCTINGADDSFTSDEDLLVCAASTGRTISTSLSHFRDAGERASLFAVLYYVARHAYVFGVRDASEGRLSDATIREFSRRRDAADERHQKMRELYDDIRPC